MNDDYKTLIDALVDIARGGRFPTRTARELAQIAGQALDDVGWEPSEEDQGLIPIPKGYAEP